MGCKLTALPPGIEQKLNDTEDELNSINKAFQAMQSNVYCSLTAKEQRTRQSKEVNEWRSKCEEKLTDLEGCVEELNNRLKSRQEQEENVDVSVNEELEELESVVASKHKQLLKYISQLRDFND